MANSETKSINFLYLIHSKSECYPEGSGLKEIRKKRECSECMFINTEERKRAVDLVVSKPPDISAINIVTPPTIGIARIDFINLFAEEAHKYLKLGRVFTKDGTIVEGFVSFVGERRLPIRGQKGSTRRTCPDCGRFIYCPEYPWYVLKDSLFDHPLYEPWPVSGLVITEDLKSRIQKGSWKGIQIIKLPVVNQAKDGVEELPHDLVLCGSR